MTGLIDFTRGTVGRILRVVLGLALIYIGLAIVGGTIGILVAVIGLLPIAMDVWGPCLLSFVFKPG